MKDVREIADYRAARAAVELWKQGADGVEKLVKQPGLGAMLVALKRAEMQTDVITVDHIYEAMRAMPQPEDDED